MPFLPRRLNKRILLFLTAILAVTGAISAWVTANRQTEQLTANIYEHSSILTRHMAGNSARYLLLRDYADLEEFLLKSAEMPNVLRLQVCEPDGALVGHIIRSRDGKLIPESGVRTIRPPAATTSFYTVSGEVMTFWHPITAGNQLGWIRADYSMVSIRQAVRDTWRQSLILALLWIISSAIMIVLVLRPTTTAFGQLAAFARRLNECKGERLTVAHDCIEIEELEQSLNYASEQLFSTEQQLLEDRERLRERETELRRLNEDLEERVRVRTAELEEKNEELYRMNRLFVGRELRMVELKEKIRALEDRQLS